MSDETETKDGSRTSETAKVYSITVVVALADGTKRQVGAMLTDASAKPVGAHVIIARGQSFENWPTRRTQVDLIDPVSLGNVPPRSPKQIETKDEGWKTISPLYAKPRTMFEVGVEGDKFNPHPENSNCAQQGCVPDDTPTGDQDAVAPERRSIVIEENLMTWAKDRLESLQMAPGGPDQAENIKFLEDLILASRARRCWLHGGSHDGLRFVATNLRLLTGTRADMLRVPITDEYYWFDKIDDDGICHFNFEEAVPKKEPQAGDIILRPNMADRSTSERDIMWKPGPHGDWTNPHRLDTHYGVFRAGSCQEVGCRPTAAVNPGLRVEIAGGAKTNDPA